MHEFLDDGYAHRSWSWYTICIGRRFAHDETTSFQSYYSSIDRNKLSLSLPNHRPLLPPKRTNKNRNTIFSTFPFLAFLWNIKSSKSLASKWKEFVRIPNSCKTLPFSDPETKEIIKRGHHSMWVQSADTSAQKREIKPKMFTKKRAK